MSKVVLDPGFEKAFLRSSQIEEVVRSAAEEVAEKAKTITESKTIAKGIKVEVGVEGGVMTGRVVATDFKSGWFQFGTVKMRARPFLDVAAISLGYKLTGGRHV